jgi:hypothetical protein
VLSVQDWAEIRRLYRSEGLPIKMIVRVMGVSRNTVKAAIASDAPPKYERVRAGSIVDEAEPRIREVLQAFPTMPATVIAERIGWDRSMTVFRDRVRELRPVYLPPDPAGRTTYLAGEIGQHDFWFPDIELPVGFGQTRPAKRLPVLTMVCGYSRWLSALLIPTRNAPDLFAGWWQQLHALGAVPRVLVWDGEGASRAERAHQGLSSVPGHAGRQGADLPAPRSGSERAAGASPRLFGTLVPARPHVRISGRFQPPTRVLVGTGERPTAPGVGLRPDRSDRRG